MNLKQSTFVTEYLRHGDKLVAYQKAYQCHGASFRTIESSSNRLLKNEEVAESINGVQQRIRDEVEQELKEELRTELLTVQRKRELLARIATGDMWIEQEDKGRDCKTCTRMVRPTINQMLKAIDLDSKLAGHYTNKKQITIVHATTPPQDQKEETKNKIGSPAELLQPVPKAFGAPGETPEKTTCHPHLIQPAPNTLNEPQEKTCHPELDSGSRDIPNLTIIKELNQLFSISPRSENKIIDSATNEHFRVRCDKNKIIDSATKRNKPTPTPDISGNDQSALHPDISRHASACQLKVQ